MLRTSSTKMITRALHGTGLNRSQYEPLGVFGQNAELKVAVWKFSCYGGRLALLAMAGDV